MNFLAIKKSKIDHNRYLKMILYASNQKINHNRYLNLYENQGISQDNKITIKGSKFDHNRYLKLYQNRNTID
ncbi:hypothetical protein BLOT_007712 [Blomia tropicalis]|nr:hypothetical protein BLOT_007712 [Blomia tropicalis]